MLSLVIPIVAAGSSRPRGWRGGQRAVERKEPAQEELGKWIWARAVEPRNSYVYARKLFKLDSNPTSAAIKACADSGYKLYVNGRYVGAGPARSASGISYYDTYDLTGLLRKGLNVVAFLVHHVGEVTYSSDPGRPGLLCRVEIDSDHGRRVILTDETWKVHAAADWTPQGGRISKGLGFQEVYDSSQRIDRWAEINCSERGWQSAEVVGTPPEMPWGSVVPRPIPNLVAETVYPTAVVGAFDTGPMHRETPVGDVAAIMASSPLTELKSRGIKNVDGLLSARGRTHVRTPGDDSGVAVVLDFGREVCGSVEIGVAGCANGVIDLGYGESLDHGRVRSDRHDARYTDRILLGRRGFEWQSFAPRAFRYLQMEFRWLGKPVAIDYVRVNQSVYPADSISTFECSDSLLNRIWLSGAQTARLCMADALMDSPRLERAQWWGDARIVSRTAYYAFGDTKLLARALVEFARAQSKEGMIPGLCPAGEQKTVPDFALLWVFSLFDYYAFSLDASLVRDLYPTACRLMAWFANHRDSDGLLCDVPGNVFIDWIEQLGRGNLTSLNCLYHQALRVMAVLASIVGRERDAEDFAADSKALKLAINKYLRSPKPGLYAQSRVDGLLVEEFDPQSNTLAALCDITDQYERAFILRWVVNCPPEQIPTPYFASFVLEALYRAGRHEEALDYIRQRWGRMVSEPPGTLWEDFAGEGGRCHGWATAPTADLIAEYVGIKPAMTPGRFSLMPHTGDLEWARGSVSTAAGPLSVNWRKTRNQFVLRVDVPKGLRVDVSPPGTPDSRVIVDGCTHAGRFVTLAGGSHQVKVIEPRQGRPQKVEGAGEPIKIPHVEVLGVGIRFSTMEAERGRVRRRRESSRPAAVVEEDAAAEGAGAAEKPAESAAPPAPSQEKKKPARRRQRSARSSSRRRGTSPDGPETSQPKRDGPSD